MASSRTDAVLPAVILSEPGSGSTTFVGLLYVTQTRVASEAGNTFRFSAPPESIRLLTSLYEQLMAGEFPTTPAADDISRVRFELGFGPSVRRGLFHRAADFEPRFRAECQWIRAEFEAMAGTLETGAPGPGGPGVLPSCSTPIFVLDPRSPGPGTTAPGSPASVRDGTMLRVVRGLAQRTGTGRNDPAHRIHPVFVFTKLDAVPEEIAPTVPRGKLTDEDYLAGERSRVGGSLVDALAPRTAAFCRSAGDRVDEPVTFFSFVKPAPDSTSTRLSTRVLPDHRVEPVYPAGQFRALIDHLGKLAAASR